MESFKLLNLVMMVIELMEMAVGRVVLLKMGLVVVDSSVNLQTVRDLLLVQYVEMEYSRQERDVIMVIRKGALIVVFGLVTIV
jgi:hypothetical protein